MIKNEKLNPLFVYIPSPKVWMTFYKSKENNQFLSSKKERLKLFKQKTFERIACTIKVLWQIFCFTKLGNYEKADIF